MYLRALAMSNIILSQIICLFVLIWLKVIFYALHLEHIYKFTQVVLELKNYEKINFDDLFYFEDSKGILSVFYAFYEYI